jgi:hypothetical protein
VIIAALKFARAVAPICTMPPYDDEAFSVWQFASDNRHSLPSLRPSSVTQAKWPTTFQCPPLSARVIGRALNAEPDVISVHSHEPFLLEPLPAQNLERYPTIVASKVPASRVGGPFGVEHSALEPCPWTQPQRQRLPRAARWISFLECRYGHFWIWPQATENDVRSNVGYWGVKRTRFAHSEFCRS